MVPPEGAHLLCCVEIIFWLAGEAVEAEYPSKMTYVASHALRVKMEKTE